MTNQYLYHGSMYNQKELMPGFKRSGVEVKWDKTESNHFLYATTERSIAENLGFASAIEKKFHLKSFHCKGDTLVAESDLNLTMEDLASLEVHIYTIEIKPDDNWVKNNNEHNRMDSEYKTKNTIENIEKTEPLNIVEWLKNKKVIFTKNVPAFEGWK